MMMIGSAFGCRDVDVDEVDVEAVDLRQELREGVQPRRQPAEVVVIGPVASELPGRREGHALRQVGDRLLLGPARRAEPLTEVVDVRLGHLDTEGPDGVRVAGGSIRGGCDVRHRDPPLISPKNGGHRSWAGSASVVRRFPETNRACDYASIGPSRGCCAILNRPDYMSCDTYLGQRADVSGTDPARDWWSTDLHWPDRGHHRRRVPQPGRRCRGRPHHDR